MENLQTSKKYFIPMEVTPETIKAFDINAENVQWSRIGNKRVRAIMVPATEEQYYAYRLHCCTLQDEQGAETHQRRREGSHQ